MRSGVEIYGSNPEVDEAYRVSFVLEDCRVLGECLPGKDPPTVNAWRAFAILHSMIQDSEKGQI